MANRARVRLRAALCGALLGLAACGGGDGGETEGPLMSPGENCISCHGAGPRGFTVAGTVFSHANDPVSAGISGVDVVISDAAGQTLTLPTNSAGNFFTSQALTLPLTVELHRGSQVMKMGQPVTSGACSSCHTQPPAGGSPGRNYISGP